MNVLPILLPAGFTPVVSLNDIVSAGQAIATQSAPTEILINIPEKLGVSLSRAKRTLQKSPGDTVEDGDILAQKKRLFGFAKDVVRSKITATIVRYERHTGNLVMQASYHSLTEKIISPVAGTVAICNNKKIVITTDKHVLVGNASSGGVTTGELFVLHNTNVLFNLDSRAIDKVILGTEFTREILVKARSIGVRGVIGTNISELDFAHFIERHIEIPIIQVDEVAKSQIEKWQGKDVSVNGESKLVMLVE